MLPNNKSDAAPRQSRRRVDRFVWPVLAVITTVVAASMLVKNAHSTPVHCSPGYQDNTCLTAIHNDPIPAPTCSTGPGWVTTGRPVWQGSHWSQPQCSYRPPPTCPAGMQQIAAPTWTGSQWTQLSCVWPDKPLPTPKVDPTSDPIAQCAQAIQQQQGSYGISDANAASDPPVLEADGKLRWHYWTANHYSDWKITWNDVYAPPKQQGSLFSFTSNGRFLVVKGARLNYGRDSGSGMDMQNFVAAVCEADPTTGAVISVGMATGFARCGGKAPEGWSGPCGR